MEWASPFARTRPPISTRLVVSNPSNRLVVVQKVQQFQCPFSPYLLRLQVCACAVWPAIQDALLRVPLRALPKKLLLLLQHWRWLAAHQSLLI